MLNQSISSYATALAESSASGNRIPAFSQHEPAMDLADAYAIQGARNAQVLASGARQIGWKIGFSAKPVMAMLGVSAPVYGILTDDRLFDAGQDIPAGRLNAPRLEGEIAFVLIKDLAGPNCTPEDVVVATAYVAPAIELVDSRLLPQDLATGAEPKALDLIADNVAFGGLIMGADRHAPEAFDLRWIGLVASLDSEVEETGLGASVYGHPLAAVAWLANQLAAKGEKISAGQTILSGSLVRHFACSSGSSALADFGEFGKISLNFA